MASLHPPGGVEVSSPSPPLGDVLQTAVVPGEEALLEGGVREYPAPHRLTRREDVVLHRPPQQVVR